jgi:hypothetical protein
MKLSRKNRLLTALIALFSMLFMQLAVASHPCPVAQDHGLPTSAMASGMPGCEQSSDPALCHAHCRDGQSALDRAELPVVAPAAVIVSAPSAPIEPSVAGPQPVVEPASWLERTTAPPIAIRHCCFRI